MSARRGTLIAVDGVNGTAVDASARELARDNRRRHAAVSRWDASGIFGELMIARADAGLPSARTLVLLYAADLAFRLRWEVKPALDEGRVVIVASYVNTAIAFGRAAGLDADSLAAVFTFAPPPDDTRLVAVPASRSLPDRAGFVEFGCDRLLGCDTKAARRDLLVRTGLILRKLEVRREKLEVKGRR